MDSIELESLRTSLRRLCAREDVSDARRMACDPADSDDTARTALDRGLIEMGLPLMLLPEELGGGGGSIGDAAFVLTELGRHAAASDLADDIVASYVVGASDPAPRDLADALTDGARFALDDSFYTGSDMGFEGELHVARWSAADPAGVLAGVRTQVGVVPGWIPWSAVTVTDERRDPAGVRRLSLRASDTGVIVLGRDPSDVVDRAGQLAQVLAAASLVGLCEGVCDLAVAYGGLRESFGRLIGSYQAYKQRCAENWVSTSLLGALLRECFDAWTTRAPEAAAMIAALAGTACEGASRAASDSILLHGAIGFTWEHDAHLYLRQALSVAARLGGATRHLSNAGQALGFSRTPA
jgi:alkylation response protein AidB-like acyl-CoA dehydrogenase